MKTYNKLIRDKIPEIIEKNGTFFISHIADDKEYIGALKNKILEELKEFYENPCAEEIGDIIEVLYAVAKYYNIKECEINRARSLKNKSRGKFEKRIILEKVGE